MRVALGVEYDGALFSGWQSQTHGNTVQDVLERALSAVASVPVATVCAGRTDAGVHAVNQVVHFDVEVVRPDTAWVRGVNANLPPAVAVCWARQVSDDFHARFSAKGRRYRYLLLNRPVRPAILQGKVGWYHAPLDLDAMRAAAELLIGEHDFSAFRSSECQAKSPVRMLRMLNIDVQDDVLIFDLEANAFLQHMVRNLIGALVYVGNGRQKPDWVADVLASRDRSKGAPTFDSAGLYLVGVEYEQKWMLPSAGRMMPPSFAISA
ncbi:MAG: tRNA pseudouridine(38-40) synthase TruA [Gammaproteobacteria bacterium]|nr:tRNA pseudouridine(38-40) synthase TruA [Gammaproteobacteria bacterium]MBU1415276.1 tRNA pseudouridine(38-40) synthase TruA [Gammaproteobacteria bacterium]